MVTRNNYPSANAIKAAVIGDPISHSLSPVIHNFFIKQNKIDGIYIALKIKENSLKSCIHSLSEMGFAGFNVTAPHKEKMLQICDFISQEAALIGAVNTVVVKDSKLYGYNSDALGFLNSLKKTKSDFELADKTWFVFGAGGAARAVIYAAISSKAKSVVITNRTHAKSKIIAEDFEGFAAANNCKIHPVSLHEFENKLQACDVLVNASSVGLYGSEFPVNLARLTKEAIVYDIVYKPLITDLLQKAKDRGNEIVTGIGMLVEQAKVGFRFWYSNSDPNLNLDCADLRRILTQEDNL